jgi:integrase
MENLQRRASGIYVARLTVPERLRHLVRKREFIATTGTSQLSVAKLVAGTLLARWRQQLFELGRLTFAGLSMNHDSIIKIADGHPLLGLAGHLPLEQAAAAVGLRADDVLRQAAHGRVRLFYRFDQAPGYLVRLDDLPEDDEPASHVVPSPAGMPDTASRLTATDPFALPRDAVSGVASALLAGSCADVVLFDAPGSADGVLAFVPDEAVTLTIDNVEVSTEDIERLRRSLAAKLAPDAIERARTAAKTTAEGRTVLGGKMAQKRFSQGVEAYCKSPDGLPGGLASISEQRQRKQGLLLFAEFMGDMRLADIDGDTLRSFRDGPLKTLPGNANKLPKGIKLDSMKATIAALKADGREWPLMSRDMQRERMLWLFRLFTWLHDKGYLSQNPAASLAGETGMTKAERKDLGRKEAIEKADSEFDDDPDEGRGPFSPDELKAIFGVQHLKTGNGSHVTKKNQVWYPFEFWLPLLGLLAGCRLKEACQLHLTDIKQVDHVWCLDLNERTADKSLKNPQSVRIVPIHPKLLDLGLIEYCERLRAAGYRRLFPELTYARSDARYAKEAGRKMSAMLAKLGMPRDADSWRTAQAAARGFVFRCPV